MIYMNHWIKNKKKNKNKKINKSWLCDLCNDGLDYGTKGRWIHIKNSKKHKKNFKEKYYMNYSEMINRWSMTSSFSVFHNGYIYEIPSTLEIINKFVKIEESDEATSEKRGGGVGIRIEFPENSDVQIKT